MTRHALLASIREALNHTREANPFEDPNMRIEHKLDLLLHGLELLLGDRGHQHGDQEAK